MPLPILIDCPKMPATELRRINATIAAPHASLAIAEVQVKEISKLLLRCIAHKLISSPSNAYASGKYVYVFGTSYSKEECIKVLPDDFFQQLATLLSHPSLSIAESALGILAHVADHDFCSDPAIFTDLLNRAKAAIDASLAISSFNPLLPLAMTVSPDLKAHVEQYLSSYLATPLPQGDLQRVLYTPEPVLLSYVASHSIQVSQPVLIATMLNAVLSQRVYGRPLDKSSRLAHAHVDMPPLTLFDLCTRNPYLTQDSALHIKRTMLFMLSERRLHTHGNSDITIEHVMQKLAEHGAPVDEQDCMFVASWPYLSPYSVPSVVQVPAFRTHRGIIEAYIDAITKHNMTIVGHILPYAPVDLWQKAILVIAQYVDGTSSNILKNAIVNRTSTDLAPILPEILDIATPQAMAALAPLFGSQDAEQVAGFFTRRRSDESRTAFLDMADGMPDSAVAIFPRAALVPYFKTTDKNIKERAMKLLGRLQAPGQQSRSAAGHTI